MKKIRLFLLTGLFLFGGCAVTHYDSLDQKPQTDILISSNVSAQIWINGQKIQENAKEHLLKQAGLDIVTLKADGYHEARVIVYRSLPEKRMFLRTKVLFPGQPGKGRISVPICLIWEPTPRRPARRQR